jgi:hypothetical protein
MTRKMYQWIIAPVVAVLFFGCYPQEADYIEELDLVYTNYYNQFDFKSVGTYAIPDSVVKITGDAYNDPDGDGKPTFVSQQYAVAILDEIKENMAAYGWTLVSKNSNPDMLILPSAMTTTNIYYYYDWWYWDWWYGGGWGWYYPCCYYPAYVTGYRSGSVLIQFVDRSSLNPNNDNAKVVWTCIFNGLAEGSTASIIERIQTNIAAGFAQSPYMKIN